MICMLSSVFFIPLIGKLLLYAWRGQMENDIAVQLLSIPLPLVSSPSLYFSPAVSFFS
jgi:hypothetical protein